MTAPRARMIGIGHEARGDDAVGLLVARRLRADARLAGTDVEVLEHDGDGMDLALLLEGPETVLLVDAVVSGTQRPGALLCFDARDAPLPAPLFAPHSTHHLGVAEAVELARVTERLPRRLLLVGVEASAFELGAPPGAAVAAVVPRVVTIALEALQSR